jgi:hypothetical protein
MSTQKRTFQVPDPLPEVIGRIYALQTKRFLAATDWPAISEDSSAEARFASDVYSSGAPARIERRVWVGEVVNGFAKHFLQAALAPKNFRASLGISHVGEVWV